MASHSRRSGRTASVTPEGANPQPGKETEGCDYKMFLACKPPTYSGERDPIKAMGWLRKIETLFDISKCSSEDKVIFAVTLLKSDARFWWDAIMSSKGSNIADGMSWEDFKIEFKDHFSPWRAMRQLLLEYVNIEQGNRTVQEYASRFQELAWFVEMYISHVDIFIWGLKDSIRELVMVKRPTTLQSAFDAAKRVEEEINRQLGERDGEKRPSNDMRRPKFARFDNRRDQRFG